jgi:dienelactone hydrolase
MRGDGKAAYYASEAELASAYRAEARKMGFSASSRSEAAAWRSSLRSKLSELIGLDRMVAVPPEPELLESVGCDGYRRDKLVIKTEAEVRMPFYALVPDGIAKGERLPCVIAPHGHLGGGKVAVAGIRDRESVAKAIDKYNYDYGRQLALEGYVALCPDARAMGERRESSMQGDDDSKYMGCSCRELSHMAMGLGRSVTGLWTWDLMRLVDYARGRDDCDPARIGAVGFSSGGQQALWLAAMDERIACAAVSGYFYGYREALFMQPGNCACNYLPHLWEYADMGDLGALIAPRLLYVETGTQDPCNGARGVDNAREQVAIARRAYEVELCPDRIGHRVFEGGHVWRGVEARRFLARMRGDPRPPCGNRSG